MILSTILRGRVAWSRFQSLVYRYSAEQEGGEREGRGERPWRADRFGYDNILSRVSVSDNLEEIFSIMGGKDAKLGPEHFAMASRAIGRVLRKQMRTTDRRRLQDFHELLQGQVANFSPQHCLDYLFYLRILQSSDLLRSDISPFMEKLQGNVNNKQYTFRNLVTIYHDLGRMDRSIKNLSAKLSEKLNEEIATQSTRNLSVVTIIQLLRTLGGLRRHSSDDMKVMNSLLEYLSNNYDPESMTIDDKVQLFNNTAKLAELVNDMPAYMNLIHSEIKELIESMTEKSIINLVEASTYLNSKRFPVGKEIRDVLFSNLEQDASSVEIDFMITFLNKLRNETSRNQVRLNKKEMELISKFFLSKIPIPDVAKKVHPRLYNLLLTTDFITYLDKKAIMASIIKNTTPLSLVDLEMGINFDIDVQAPLTSLLSVNHEKSFPMNPLRVYSLLASIPAANITPQLAEIKAKNDEKVDNIFAQNEVISAVKGLERCFLADKHQALLFAKILEYLEKMETFDPKSATSIIGILLKASTTKENLEKATKLMERVTQQGFRRSVWRVVEASAHPNNFYQIRALLNFLELNPVYFSQLSNDTLFIKESWKSFLTKRAYFNLLRKTCNMSTTTAAADDTKSVEGTSDTKDTAPKEASTGKPVRLASDQLEAVRILDHLRSDDPLYADFLTELAASNISDLPLRTVRILANSLFKKGLLTKANATNLLAAMEARAKKASEAGKEVRQLNGGIDNILKALANNSSLERVPPPKNSMDIGVLLHHPQEQWEAHAETVAHLVEKLGAQTFFTLLLNIEPKLLRTNHPVMQAFFKKLETLLETMRPQQLVRVAEKLSEFSYAPRQIWNELSDAFWEKETQSIEKTRFLKALSQAHYDQGKYLRNHFDDLLQSRNYGNLLRALFDSHFILADKEFKALIEASKNFSKQDNSEFAKLLAINQQLPEAQQTLKEVASKLDHYTYLLKNFLIAKLPELNIKEDKEVKEAKEAKELSTRDERIKQELQKLAADVGLPFKEDVTVGDFTYQFQFGNTLLFLPNRSFFLLSGRPSGKGQLLLGSLQHKAGSQHVAMLNPRNRIRLETLKNIVPELQNNEKFAALLAEEQKSRSDKTAESEDAESETKKQSKQDKPHKSDK